MKVLTAAQMQTIDRLTTERYGVPSLQLMENAGTRVVEFLVEQVQDLRSRRVVVLCGKGNNGGDGFVIARLLKQEGCDVCVLAFAKREDYRGDAAINLQRWEQQAGASEHVTSETKWEAKRASLAQADLIVDALLGTGLQGPVKGLLATVIDAVNHLVDSSCVVAVDLPSGLSADSGKLQEPFVRADMCVTFTAPKICHVLPPACEYMGVLRVVAIGTPAVALTEDASLNLSTTEPSEFRELKLRRRHDAHKGDFGHALIIAGSRGKTGAAILAAHGALRSGAGLVTVATPASELPTVAGGLPEMMTEPLPCTETGSISLQSLDYGRFWEICKGKSVLALGPGLSVNPETRQFVRSVTAEASIPLILDADALNAFAGRASGLKTRRAAFLAVTPHPGEMGRLIGCETAEVQANRLEIARKAAAEWNAFVILKGYKTIIADPDGRAFVNSTGNPGMATGGTGDVLTGILAGLTAQLGVEDWLRVLALGVYLHGAAGDFAAQEVGEHSLLATDLIRKLPAAIQALLSRIHE